MQSIDQDFNDLVKKIEKGRDFTSASFEPIYYLVFPPEQIIQVKRQTPAWIARLRKRGFKPHIYSISDAIRDVHQSSPLRKFWLNADAKKPLQWNDVNNSLSVALEAKGDEGSPLQLGIETKLAEIESIPNSILLITDLEALHPYLRIGAIEAQLYGQFKAPTVFLYPGIRLGKSKLSFLGFYPEDGNYRSVHVGG